LRQREVHAHRQVDRPLLREILSRRLHRSGSIPPTTSAGAACSKGTGMHSTWNRYALMGALAALLVLLGATASQAAAASGIGHARPFALRQLVVKFEGEPHGRTVGLPRGA